MSVERQQGELYQDLLFELDESVEKGLRPGASSDRVSGTSAIEEKQSLAEVNEQRALTMNLMEQVVERSNLNRAYRKVRTNRGSAGVDGMTIVQRMVQLARLCQPLRQIYYVKPSTETAGYDEYVRWCGRTEAVRLPPTRFNCLLSLRFIGC